MRRTSGVRVGERSGRCGVPTRASDGEGSSTTDAAMTSGGATSRPPSARAIADDATFTVRLSGQHVASAPASCDASSGASTAAAGGRAAVSCVPWCAWPAGGASRSGTQHDRRCESDGTTWPAAACVVSATHSRAHAASSAGVPDRASAITRLATRLVFAPTDRVYAPGHRLAYHRLMKTLAGLSLGVLAGLAVTGAQQDTTPGSAADWRPAITALGSPAADGSAQPQMTVSPRGVLLSWIERTGATATLKFAERTATGWTPAQTAASGDDWFVNWADVPQCCGSTTAPWPRTGCRRAAAIPTRTTCAWPTPRTTAGRGRRRSPRTMTARRPNTASHRSSRCRAPGSASSGSTAAAWPGGGHDAHAAAGGAMSVRFGTFDTAVEADRRDAGRSRVCECCPTTAAMTSDGPIVAFRNRSEDEIRDIYVSRLEQGRWTAPVAVHDDGWKIAACPVNGPMLSARGRDVVLAWFTLKNDVGPRLRRVLHRRRPHLRRADSTR